MWSLANISNKSSEVVPTITNFDAAAAVIFIFLNIWIITTIMHGAPNEIERIYFSFFSVAMFMISFFATTRACSTIEMTGLNYSPGAAIATAKPTAANAVVGRSYCNQSTETLTCDINWLDHDGLLEGCLVSGEAGAASTGFAAHSSRRLA